MTNLEVPSLFEWVSETFESLTKWLSELKDRVSLKEESALYKEFTSVSTSVDTKDIKEKSNWFMKAIGGVFNIDIPLFWTLGWAFGAKWPVDIFGNKEKRKQRKVINKLLNFFGIKWWLEELHRDYIDQNLKWINQEFVKSAFQKYDELEKDNIGSNDIWSAYWLEAQTSALNEEQKNTLKDKLPDGDENLKTALFESLGDDVVWMNLNVSTVALLWQEYLEKDANNNVIGIDYPKIQENKAKFVDDYLNKIIPMLILSQDDFINSTFVNKETFALAIFGSLVGERYFMEWLNIWLIDINQYKTKESSEKLVADIVEQDVGEKELDENSPEYLSEIEKRGKVMEQADLFAQKKVVYKWWGWREKTQSWLDCSWLIIASMNNAWFNVPWWDSRQMFRNLKQTRKLETKDNWIKPLDNVKPWDLLFWNSTNPSYKWSTGQIPRVRKWDIDYRIHHVAFVKNIDYDKWKVVVVEANWSKWVVESEIDVKKELKNDKHKSELFVWTVEYSNLLAYEWEKKEVKIA